MMDQKQVQEQSPVSRSYAVDLAWFPAMLRDFRYLVGARMCASCQARLGEETEERVPRADATGKVVFETRRVRYGDDPVAVVAECCSQQLEYNNGRLPLMEIVFRLLLANRNQPLTLEEITDRAVDWVHPGDGRVITPSVIERLLLADDFYGIQPVEGEQPAPVAAAAQG